MQGGDRAQVIQWHSVSRQNVTQEEELVQYRYPPMSEWGEVQIVDSFDVELPVWGQIVDKVVGRTIDCWIIDKIMGVYRFVDSRTVKALGGPDRTFVPPAEIPESPPVPPPEDRMPKQPQMPDRLFDPDGELAVRPSEN